MNTVCSDIPTIQRSLWHTSDDAPDGKVVLPQSELIGRTEPLVILGEAGMGKTTLLQWLAGHDGYALCTASQLANRHGPRSLQGDAEVLVIDALDECAASKEGTAVDAVLRKLGELNYPRFVLACRAADWRNATAPQAIREQYDQQPVVLHLEALSSDDIAGYLATRLGEERASAVREHLATRRLGNLLGNPHTLTLIANVAAAGELPATKYELFNRSVSLMWEDHKKSKAELQPAESIGLDAAGAACAALILTGRLAIARAATHHEDLPLQEITQLPGGAEAKTALDTRLFRALGNGRFSYWHRSIGEFLAARWLASRANTPRKRRRLLATLRMHGLVPSSLRGLHAWLAHDPKLAPSIIETDPLGFIEYGDADTLSPTQARHLLPALQHVAAANPHAIGWSLPAAKRLFQADLIGDILTTITSPDTPFGLRRYLIDAAKETPLRTELAHDLQQLILDPGTAHGIKSSAIETMADVFEDDVWQDILHGWQGATDESSPRLAIKVLNHAGHHLADDATIAQLVVATNDANENLIGATYPLETNLPVDRLDGVLDQLAALVATRDMSDRRSDWHLADFARTLVARRIGCGEVLPHQLWKWLKPFRSDCGSHDSPRNSIEAYLRDHAELRLAIQRLAILDAPPGESVRAQTWQLAECSPSLRLSAGDAVSLLRQLANNDPRWREITAEWGHDAEVRTAARPFALGNPEASTWLDSLANPVEPEWQREQTLERQRRAEERAREHQTVRESYLPYLAEMRSGSNEWIIGPAQAYLEPDRSIGRELPAHERVAQWLGTEAAVAAHQGFDAFLLSTPAEPSASDIAKSHADGKRLEAEYIIIAALAERARNGTGFADLTDERVMAGLFALRTSAISKVAGIEFLDQFIETEISRRNLLEPAMRLFHEPQLKARRDHIAGLERLMRDPACKATSAKLALEWLKTYDDQSLDTTRELISRVAHSEHAAALRGLITHHAPGQSTTHQHVWDAAGLMVDFESAAARLSRNHVAPELLWEIRDMTTRRAARKEAKNVLAPALAAWVFATFRRLWPVSSPPTGGSYGDQNPWNATRYLNDVLANLAKDHGEQACTALRELHSGATDGYSEHVSAMLAEQAMLRATAAYISPSVSAIAAVLNDAAPIAMNDLLAVMLDELEIVQAKIRSNDVDSWRPFFDGENAPQHEEPCRDRLVDLLRQGCQDIDFEVEAHRADDKEVDIVCRCGDLRLPIEVKGQWHRELWHAADTQLDRLYASDWQAERRGIYLVLWFGPQTDKSKRLKGAGAGEPLPKSPPELRDALTARSPAAREGRIAVVVLDMTRPPP